MKKITCLKEIAEGDVENELEVMLGTRNQLKDRGGNPPALL